MTETKHREISFFSKEFFKTCRGNCREYHRVEIQYFGISFEELQWVSFSIDEMRIFFIDVQIGIHWLGPLH